MGDAYRFHRPDEIELAFLRIVTRGYPELQSQIENCEVDDYDETGWLDLRVQGGQAMLDNGHHEGPHLTVPGYGVVEIILFVNAAGLLESVEIVDYGFTLENVYQAFIDGAASSTLRYNHPGA